ncbi:MAG: hemolysin family protein [Actinomycetota bacterium]
MSILVGLLVVIALVLASGMFVAIEFSLIAADRQRLEDLATEGRWPARAALRAVKRLSYHLSGAQLGITVTSLLLGYLTESVIAEALVRAFGSAVGGSGSTLSIGLALLVATVFQMVVGELIPKNIAISRPNVTAQIMAPIALVVHGVLSPVIIMFNGAANWLVRRLGVEPKEEIEVHRSLDELEYLIKSSGDSGALDPDSHSLLTRTLRFGDKTAADALTPRVHVAAVPVDATVADLAAEVARSRHSRYPVYESDLDHVRGVVVIGAIFATPLRERDRTPIAAIMDEPLVVPETRDLVDILDDFRAAPVPMAVVLDEHGGTAGILTLEDVLEELVGDVDDEHDPEPLTGGVGPGVFVAAGTLHPDEVAELSGLVIPPGDYETIAGFVLHRLGRIPEPGDAVDHTGWRLEVAEMDGLRIAALQLRAPAAAVAGAEGAP